VGGLIGGTLAALAIRLGDRVRAPALALTACTAIAAAAVVGSIVTAKASEVESVNVPATVVGPEEP